MIKLQIKNFVSLFLVTLIISSCKNSSSTGAASEKKTSETSDTKSNNTAIDAEAKGTETPGSEGKTLGKLSTIPAQPSSVEVFLAGKKIASDDGAGKITKLADSATEVSGTVDYTTGDYQLNIIIPINAEKIPETLLVTAKQAGTAAGSLVSGNNSSNQSSSDTSSDAGTSTSSNQQNNSGQTNSGNSGSQLVTFGNLRHQICLNSEYCTLRCSSNEVIVGISVNFRGKNAGSHNLEIQCASANNSNFSLNPNRHYNLQALNQENGGVYCSGNDYLVQVASNARGSNAGVGNVEAQCAADSKTLSLKNNHNMQCLNQENCGLYCPNGELVRGWTVNWRGLNKGTGNLEVQCAQAYR